MSYIGNPIVSTDFPKDTFSGNGSTTAFTMQIAPASVNSVIVVVSGITQDPSTYTISGTTLTFSAAPPTGTNNISVRHLGVAGIPNTPSAGSVGPSAINSSYSLWNLSGSDINYTAGNVGIGTASPNLFASTLNMALGSGSGSAGLTVYTGTSSTGALYFADGTSGADRYRGGIEYTHGDNAMLFTTDGSERMRITSAGNLCVGITATIASSRQTVSFTANTANGIDVSDSTNTAGATFCVFSNGSSTIGSIGRVSSTSAVAYNTTSDQRLKSNITDADPVLDKLMDVQVRQFDWTDGDLHQDAGFIAQELSPVLSGIVTEGKTEEDIWQLDYSRLTPYLVKAIQELKVIVDAQAVEIAALKGTV